LNCTYCDHKIVLIVIIELYLLSSLDCTYCDHWIVRIVIIGLCLL